MSPRRELLRHFLETFFDSEALAVSGEWKKTAIGVLAAFLSVGIVVFQTYSKRYAVLNSPLPSIKVPMQIDGYADPKREGRRFEGKAPDRIREL